MLAFLFGRRKKIRRKVRVNKKPPKALIKRARKYKVRVTIKKGSRRVYKSVRLILKQIKQKKKNLKRNLK